jgi:acetylornithine deacetylase
VSSNDAIDLLVRMVEIPSVSGGEEALVAMLADELRDIGVAPVVSGRNVWCAVEGADGPGRTLLLQAHIDTVPPSEQWSSDPFRALRAGGKLQALGANDVKGGGAAMITALRSLAVHRDFAGTLVFAATCDEETGGQGLEVLRPELPAIDASVIAEPTRMCVATAQRGLLRATIACHGKSAHASRPWQGKNAIIMAMEDIQSLLEIERPVEHPVLGKATVVVTMIDGGVGVNVVPPVCRYTIDCRPTPTYPNEYFEREIRARVQGNIEALRGRIVPVETASDDPLVLAALAATEPVTGRSEPVAMGGVSDLFHVRDKPGIVLGPGTSEQSHQADEWIEEQAVHDAVGVYADVVRRYLAP